MIDPRTRLSSSFNRNRLSLEAKRSRGPLLVILAAAVLAFCGFLYLIDHLDSGSGAKNTVRFAADDVTGLVSGRAEVRFKGIPAGIVHSVDVENDQSVITADVLKKYGPIYKDATAEMRPNTPLQDMYLDITDRGTPAAGLAGDEPLRTSQTSTSVNISAVLSAFQPDTRAHLRTLLNELGQGLADKGAALRESFVELGPLIAVVGRLSDQLAARADATRRVVHNVGELTKVLADREVAVRDLVRFGATALSATSSQSSALGSTLHELPLALHELDTSFAAVGHMLPDLDQAVRRIDPIADDLPRSLNALQGLSSDARPAVHDLQKPVGDLVPLSNRLRPFSQTLDKSIGDLRPQTSDADRITKDIAGCHVAAYMFFQWTASLGKLGDASGAYPRGDFGFGADSLSGVKDPGITASPSCARGGPKGSKP
jgi:ABC-type transporter Mla subunit MlaD